MQTQAKVTNPSSLKCKKLEVIKDVCRMHSRFLHMHHLVSQNHPMLASYCMLAASAPSLLAIVERHKEGRRSCLALKKSLVGQTFKTTSHCKETGSKSDTVKDNLVAQFVIRVADSFSRL